MPLASRVYQKCFKDASKPNALITLAKIHFCGDVDYQPYAPPKQNANSAETGSFSQFAQQAQAGNIEAADEYMYADSLVQYKN